MATLTLPGTSRRAAPLPSDALALGDRGARPPSPWLLLLPVGIALALLPAAFSGGLLVALAGVAVLLARPRWALYLLAFTVPYQGLVDFKVAQVSVSVTEGVVGLLLLAWMTQLAAGRAARPGGGRLLAAVAVLLTTFSLSLLVATDLTLSAKEMLKWTEMAAVYLVGTSMLETPRQRRTLLVCLLLAGLSEAGIGLVQSVLRIGPPHFLIGGVLMRAYGTFEQPNPFGGYLGLSLPLAVALYLYGMHPGFWRRVLGLAAAALAAALVITLSRGAWMGQVVALLLVIMSGSRMVRHAVTTFGALGLVLLAGAWPLLPPELSGRLTSVVTSALDLGSIRDTTVTPENWAVMERLSQWYAGFQMFVNNPVLGVGIGNYNAAYDTYRLEQWPVALGHAHNHYLTVAAEAGLLGLAAYVLFLVVAFASAMAAFKQARGALSRAVALGALGSLASFATHDLFDVLFVHGMGVTIGLLLVLVHGAPSGFDQAGHAGRAGDPPINNTRPRPSGRRMESGTHD